MPAQSPNCRLLWVSVMPAFFLLSHPSGRLCSGLFHGCTIMGNSTVPPRFFLPSPADLHVKSQTALFSLPGHLLSNRLEPLAPWHFPCSHVTPPLRLGSNQWLGWAKSLCLVCALCVPNNVSTSLTEKISVPTTKKGLQRTPCTVLWIVSTENRMLSHWPIHGNVCRRISPQTVDLSVHLLGRKNSNRKGLEEDLEHHLENKNKSICQSAYSLWTWRGCRT